MSYVQKQYKPRVLIDLATLTGACLVALGRYRSGLLSNSDKLAKDLLKAGEVAMLFGFEDRSRSLRHSPLQRP